jgi:hypothetical protein
MNILISGYFIAASMVFHLRGPATLCHSRGRAARARQPELQCIAKPSYAWSKITFTYQWFLLNYRPMNLPARRCHERLPSRNQIKSSRFALSARRKNIYDRK